MFQRGFDGRFRGVTGSGGKDLKETFVVPKFSKTDLTLSLTYTVPLSGILNRSNPLAIEPTMREVRFFHAVSFARQSGSSSSPQVSQTDPGLAPGG